MTDALQDLDNAVQRYIAEAFPGSVTDAWVLVSHSNGLEDDTHDLHNYRLTEASESQPWHTSAGLVQAGTRIIKDAWDFDDEDD